MESDERLKSPREIPGARGSTLLLALPMLFPAPMDAGCAVHGMADVLVLDVPGRAVFAFAEG